MNNPKIIVPRHLIDKSVLESAVMSAIDYYKTVGLHGLPTEIHLYKDFWVTTSPDQQRRIRKEVSK